MSARVGYLPMTGPAAVRRRHDVARRGADGWLRWLSRPRAAADRAEALSALGTVYGELALVYPLLDWSDERGEDELLRDAEGWWEAGRVLRLLAAAERSVVRGGEPCVVGDVYERHAGVRAALADYTRTSGDLLHRAVLVDDINQHLMPVLHGNAPDELDALAHAFERAHDRARRRARVSRLLHR